MAKKKDIKTTQMNVRIQATTLKNARAYVKKSKTRLGLLVDKALQDILQVLA